MHFNHPELLYALLLLVIPVLVHLFQLRKFRREKFTNVKFLKKAVLQTRKSSRLKKWLILATRLFLLAAVIIAFAQPYLPTSIESPQRQETVIYLDNSYSMQAKGSGGILLRRAVQDLLENLSPEQDFTLFTNSSEFQNVNLDALRKDLQGLSFSPVQLDWATVQLKARQFFSESPNTRKNFIAISDFQEKNNSEELAVQEGIDYNLVQLQPENTRNITADTAYIVTKKLDEIILSLELTSSGNSSYDVPVSLYNGNTLLAKKNMSFEENSSVSSTFSLSSSTLLNGRISIEDPGLAYDNELFFSINESGPVNVTVLGEDHSSFLQRIFSKPDFDLKVYPVSQVDYNSLSRASLIILNELEEIPPFLSTNIHQFLEEGVLFVVIPSDDLVLDNYNSFFKQTDLPIFREKIDQEKLITDISYAHPLYEEVFEEEISNFQYPKVQSFFRINPTEVPVLSMENTQAFLFQKNNFFVFTAALNPQNSNFTNAPLIVPTFYNMGNMALSPARLYYELGKSNTIDISVTGLEKDEILQMVSSEFSFIPQQRSFQNKVEILLEDTPEDPGNYLVMKDIIPVTALSFNLDRSESILRYRDLSKLRGARIHSEIPRVFEEFNSKNEVHALWKWFVIFAMFLLITEMLILKYIK